MTDSSQNSIDKLLVVEAPQKKKRKKKRKIRLSKTAMAAHRAAVHKSRSEAAKNSPNAVWKTPEWQAKRAAARVRGGQNSSRAGVPNGYTRDGVKRARRVYRTQAIRLVQKIIEMADEETKKILTEDERARQALEVSTEIMLSKGNELVSTKDRIAAARTVLEWTKKKPAVQNDVTVRTAEDFLDDLAKEDDKSGSGESTPQGDETPSS